MDTQSVLAEVERRVAERLPGVLFEKGLVLHAKRSFSQGCGCSYCKIKREATAKIGVVKIDNHFWNYEDRKEYKEKIRERFRVIYRKRLKFALEEAPLNE